MSTTQNDSGLNRQLLNGIKHVTDFFKENRQLDIAGVFAAAVLVLILVGTLAWEEPVVPVCIALMIEAGIAILLHNAELWIHGAAVVIQLVAGILIGRTSLMILCIVLYALTIAALQALDKADKTDSSK
jgi:lysylphosphatidylglycerol synthetase-like protein (DUF2156 family)